jgi:hypothetical protein
MAKLDIVQVANRITITAKEEMVINGGWKLPSASMLRGHRGGHLGKAH